MSIPKVSIRQIKAARALLAWSQEQMAERSGVSIPTVKRLESSDGPLGGRPETVRKLVRALESSGAIFLEENGGGPGVRLRKHRKPVGVRPAETRGAARTAAEKAVEKALADVPAPPDEKAERKRKLTRIAKTLKEK